jgi:hypothetical protein
MQFDPIDGTLPVHPDHTEVVAAALPWYEHVQLVRATDARWSVDLGVYFLYGPGGKLRRLQGGSAPIHEVNARAPIRLNEENVLAYLRFFCFFVRGEEGPFYIADSIDDPLIPRDIESDARSAIAGALHAPSVNGRDEDGRFLCSATVFYANVLFESSFAVESNGQIEMIEDDPLVADLPHRIRAPIGVHREEP